MALTIDTKTRINYLAAQIRWNRANLNEYKEYIDILLRNGVTPEKINNTLSPYGFQNIEDYVRARHEAITLEQKHKMNDAIVTGGLLAIGVALILGLASKK